jgi:hypothetical protein
VSSNSPKRHETKRKRNRKRKREIEKRKDGRSKIRKGKMTQLFWNIHRRRN